jgi:amino acid transporter
MTGSPADCKSVAGTRSPAGGIEQANRRYNGSLELSDEIPTLEAFGYRQELKRSLSLFDLTVYGLVFINPIAPVVVFGIVYNASHGMVPLVYLVGLVAMLFTARSYMSMSRAFPVAGSVYAYAAHSLGPLAGFFAGWAILLDYLLMPALFYVAGAIALHSAVPAIPEWIWVTAQILFATIVNYFGIETTARTNSFLFVIAMVVLMTFIAFAVFAVAHHVDGAQFSTQPLFDRARFTPGLIFSALSLAVLSFLGFDAISTLSEESRSGSQAVARATILSLCIAAVLFVLQTWLASFFVPVQTGFPPGAPANQAFYNVAEIIGGYWLKFLIAVPATLVCNIGGALSAQAATARLIFGMARDGRLPRVLAHVGSKRKVPERAILLVAAVTLMIGLGSAGNLELLASMVSFGALLGFLALHASVISHFGWRTKSRNWLRHWIAPAIGFVIIAYVLWNAEPNAKIAGGMWLFAGVLVRLSLRATRPANSPQAGM